MRKMTLKTTLFSAALLASVLEVQAQNIRLRSRVI